MNSTELTPKSLQSRAMFLSALLLAQQYNITIGGNFIGWQLLNTSGNPMNTLGKTCDLISTSNIVGIVGPVISREAHIIAPYAEEIGIPVISHAASDPKLSDKKAFPTFHRTVPSDNIAALAIAKLFIQYKWTACTIVYQNDAFGVGGATAISEVFNMNNLTVAQMIVFDIETLTLRDNLKSVLTNSPTRIVILWAEILYASLILKNALNADVVGPHFTWISSVNVPWNSSNRTYHEKLSGILTVAPVVGSVINAPTNTKLLKEAYTIWQKYEPESFPGSENVNDYALFAFDATWTLIHSLKRLCATNQSCISFVNTSSCFDRLFLNSRQFLDIIAKTVFLGVSGPVEFSLNETDRTNGIYYVIKNLQSVGNSLNYVPVLFWSYSLEWASFIQTNTIIWPGNLYKAPTGYASISGVTVRIALIESDPYTKFTEIKDRYGNIKRELTGYVPDLIKILREKIGFNPIITVYPSNESYNGLIDVVANNSYDMVIGDVTILASRREKVRFSNPIFDNQLRLIMRDESSDKLDYFLFLKPFSPVVWIIFLSTMLWFAILLYLFEGRKNEKLRYRPIIVQIGVSMHYPIGTIFGHDPDFHVKTVAGRFLTIGIYILSFVMIAAYQANLTSYLTITKSKGVISGIDDIKNGKIPFHRIGILTDSSIEDFYLREISDGSRNFYPLRTQDEIYSKLLDKTIDVSIMDAGGSEYRVGNFYCNLTLVGAAFSYSAYGIVFQKNWIYEQILDVTILSLREAGVLDDLKSKWFNASYCPHSSEISNGLQIKSMAGLFITTGGIIVISILVFVVEYCLSKRNKRYVYSVSRAAQTDSDCSISIEYGVLKKGQDRTISTSCETQTVSDLANTSSISFVSDDKK